MMSKTNDNEYSPFDEISSIIEMNGFICVDDYIEDIEGIEDKSDKREEILNHFEGTDYKKVCPYDGNRKKIYLKKKNIEINIMTSIQDFTRYFVEGILTQPSLAAMLEEMQNENSLQRISKMNKRSNIDLTTKEFEYKVRRKQENFYYRGHGSTNYTLLPNIQRDEALNKHESNLYYEMIARHPEEFSDFKRHLDALQLMQHYSLPTRLLDITRNPLVALYFTVSSNLNLDGELVVFEAKENLQKHMYSDSVEVLCALASLPSEVKTELLTVSNDYRHKLSGNDAKDEDIIEKFNNEESTRKLLHQIKAMVGHFENTINPNDLFDLRFVNTKKDNARIVRQDGNFIVTGLYTHQNKEELAEKINKERYSNSREQRYIIPSIFKEKMLKSLAVMRIDESTIYPEMEYTAKYLIGKFRH